MHIIISRSPWNDRIWTQGFFKITLSDCEQLTIKWIGCDVLPNDERIRGIKWSKFSQY